MPDYKWTAWVQKQSLKIIVHNIPEQKLLYSLGNITNNNKKLRNIKPGVLKKIN